MSDKTVDEMTQEIKQEALERRVSLLVCQDRKFCLCVHCAMGLNLAIASGHPIVLMVTRGAEVPEKLAKIVDPFVEVEPVLTAEICQSVLEALREVAR